MAHAARPGSTSSTPHRHRVARRLTPDPAGRHGPRGHREGPRAGGVGRGYRRAACEPEWTTSARHAARSPPWTGCPTVGAQGGAMVAGRRCLDCPRIGPWKRGRCTEHDRAHDQARGTSTQRGYGTTHTRLRATYQGRMDAGMVYHCWRCTDPIDPTRWDLGHDDHDRSITRGPECLSCNRSTSTRR